MLRNIVPMSCGTAVMADAMIEGNRSTALTATEIACRTIPPRVANTEAAMDGILRTASTKRIDRLWTN
ncbi:MAG: hypothetical protein KDA71_09605 [Planctomycetales bacterium]|nr:hypothetical protein [Planctomycetales bacterium]